MAEGSKAYQNFPAVWAFVSNGTKAQQTDKQQEHALKWRALLQKNIKKSFVVKKKKKQRMNERKKERKKQQQ